MTKKIVQVECDWVEIHHKVVDVEVDAEFDEDLEEWTYDEDSLLEWAEELATWNTPNSCEHTEFQDSKILGLKEKEVKAGCNADSHDDGIPPKDKSLGILPTIL